jgi:Na+/melibiose symporter-like transporter
MSAIVIHVFWLGDKRGIVLSLLIFFPSNIPSRGHLSFGIPYSVYVSIISICFAFHGGEFVPRILYTSIRGKRSSDNQIDNSSNMSFNNRWWFCYVRCDFVIWLKRGIALSLLIFFPSNIPSRGHLSFGIPYSVYVSIISIYWTMSFTSYYYWGNTCRMKTSFIYKVDLYE